MPRDRAHLRHQHEPGERFGHIVLVRYVRQDKYGQVWRVRCDCGRTFERQLASLKAHVRRSGDARCRACATREWISTTAPRVSLAGMAARYGDREAFILRDLRREQMEGDDDGEQR